MIDRGPSLDANDDRLSNLLHYALGGVHPTFEISGSEFVYRWQELPGLYDVKVSVRASGDLQRWSRAADTIINNAPGLELHQSTVPLRSGHRYLRLEATRP